MILLLLSATDEQSTFSPRMSSMFGGKPVIGVITKTDLCRDKERIEIGKEIQKSQEHRKSFEIGFGDDACIETLKSRIEKGSPAIQIPLNYGLPGGHILLCNSSYSLNCYLVIRFMVIFYQPFLASMTPGAAGADITDHILLHPPSPW